MRVLHLLLVALVAVVVSDIVTLFLRADLEKGTQQQRQVQLHAQQNQRVEDNTYVASGGRVMLPQNARSEHVISSHLSARRGLEQISTSELEKSLGVGAGAGVPWPEWDLTPEQMVADMIATHPSTRHAVMQVLVSPEQVGQQYGRSASQEILEAVLKRWAQRVHRPLKTFSSLTKKVVIPSIALVASPCDPSRHFAEAFFGCGDERKECPDLEFAEHMKYLTHLATEGPLLLIPSDMVQEGLVLMNLLFHLNPGDLLHLQPTGIEHRALTAEECAISDGVSPLWELAKNSLQARIEKAGRAFEDRLSKLATAQLFLPQYCNGVHANPYTQCKLMTSVMYKGKSNVLPKRNMNLPTSEGTWRRADFNSIVDETSPWVQFAGVPGKSLQYICPVVTRQRAFYAEKVNLRQEKVLDRHLERIKPTRVNEYLEEGDGAPFVSAAKGKVLLEMSRAIPKMLLACGTYDDAVQMSTGVCGMSRRGIVFIKTQKTHSETLEGIFLRLCGNGGHKCFTHTQHQPLDLHYAEHAAQLHFPLPNAPAFSPPYDVFVANALNQRTDFVVPSAQGHVISVVSEPVMRFATHFSFWLPPASYVVGGREEEYPWTASELSKFCKDATRSKDLQSALNKEPLSYRPSLNSMSRQLMGCVDCGSEDDMHKRFDDLLAEIKAPNSKFHIAISERFHESLILLKRDYHLQFADLAYVSRNKMDQGYREHKMSDELGQCLHDLNYLDAELYRTALEVHSTNIKHAGRYIKKEVSVLDELASRTQKTCEYSTSVSTVEYPERLKPYSRYCRNEGKESHFADDTETVTGGRTPYDLNTHPLCTQCDLINGFFSVSRIMNETFSDCVISNTTANTTTSLPPANTTHKLEEDELHVRSGDAAIHNPSSANATGGVGIGVGRRNASSDLAFIGESEKSSSSKAKYGAEGEEVWSLFSAGSKEEKQKRKKWHAIRDQASSIVKDQIDIGAVEKESFDAAARNQHDSDTAQLKVSKKLKRGRKEDDAKEAAARGDLLRTVPVSKRRAAKETNVRYSQAKSGDSSDDSDSSDASSSESSTDTSKEKHKRGTLKKEIERERDGDSSFSSGGSEKDS